MASSVFLWPGTFTIPGNVVIGGNLTIGGVVLNADGSASAPSYSFTLDSNTGAYRPGDDQFGFATGGTGRAMFDGSGGFRPITDATGTIGTSAARWVSANFSSNITFGVAANAATLGFLRATNNTDIVYARNAGGSGDLLVLATTGSNAIRLGGSGVARVEAKADDGIKVLLNSAAASHDAFWFTADNEAHFAGYVYNDTAGNDPEFLGYRARGTIASPTAVQTDDRLVLLSGWGNTPTQGFKEVGQVNVLAENAFTDTQSTWNGYIQFRTLDSSVDQFVERWRISSGGSLIATGYSSGARLTTSSLQQVTTAVTLAGASTGTGNVIPAGAEVVGVSTTTTTTITGASGYQVGDGSDADRYGDITGTAVGTASGSTNYTADPRWWTAAARAITLTAKTSNFTGGVVQVTVFYRSAAGA